jgi:putative FmdB family regulatory protein
MPIYEYQSVTPQKGCDRCLRRFEVIQTINEKELATCPDCGQRVRKVVSRCRAIVVEANTTYVSVKQNVKDYEKNGMWSHAAELADRYAEKVNDRALHDRALENYAKAGYEDSTIETHQNTIKE